MNYLVESSDGADVPAESLNNIVAVMGITGSGKSTLIGNITGQDVRVGHGLESCTTTVHGYEFYLGNMLAVLIDTPGFDDTYKTDTEVLEDIHRWLSLGYRSNVKPKGILFLHKINENRMMGSSLRFLEMFRGLCGDDCMSNVVLVTTMWSEVTAEDGERRERDLCENFWRPMIACGAGVARYDGNNTIRALLDNILGMRSPNLRIVVETEEEGRALGDTSAAQVINRDLIAQKKEFEEERSSIMREHAKAISEGNNKMAELMQEHKDELDKRQRDHKRSIEIMARTNEETKKKYAAEMQRVREENKKMMKSAQQDSSQTRILRRLVGSGTIMTGIGIAAIFPPLGIPIAIAGGGLIGSTFAARDRN